MAPLKLPPPALTLEEATELEQALIAPGGEFSTQFTGQALEQVLQDQPKYSKIGAVPVCEALLEHRLLHSVSDDDGFAPTKRYAFISKETPEVRSIHAAQSKLINESLVQGKILWKRSSFFGLMTHFDPVYGVLSQDKLTLLRSRSAASSPLMEIPIKELHEQRECINCKAEWYCFDILTKDHSHIVLCADHSKRQEAWMTKLNEMGVTFVRSNDIENDDVTKFNNLFELEARRLNSEETVPFTMFEGNVCLVVNVSTLCGLTPQYAELEALYEKYKERGFRVLAFPVNQFLNQEPGTEAEIEQFAKTKYNVTFDMFEKTNCNGKSAHPVFRFVKSRLGGVLGSSVKWNFTKFLVDRNGTPVQRFAPTATPFSFEDEIVALL